MSSVEKPSLDLLKVNYPTADMQHMSASDQSYSQCGSTKFLNSRHRTSNQVSTKNLDAQHSSGDEERTNPLELSLL